MGVWYFVALLGSRMFGEANVPLIHSNTYKENRIIEHEFILCVYSRDIIVKNVSLFVAK